MTILKNTDGHFRAIWRILFYFVLFLAFSKIFDMLSGSFLLIQGEELSDNQLLVNRFITKTLKFLAVLLPAVLLLKYLDKRPVAMLGLGFYKGNLKELSNGMLIGLVVGSISIGIIALFGFASFTLNIIHFELILYFLFILIILIISAAFEEVFFRGYIFQALMEGTNLIVTLVIFSLLFGAAHLSNEGVTAYAIIFTVCAGVFLGVLYYKTRSLWICIGVHYIWNFVVAPVFGIGVDNNRFLNNSIFTYTPIESNFPIGAEAAGDLIQSIVMLILTVIIWKSSLFKTNSYNAKLWENYPVKVGFKHKSID